MREGRECVCVCGGGARSGMLRDASSAIRSATREESKIIMVVYGGGKGENTGELMMGKKGRALYDTRDASSWTCGTVGLAGCRISTMPTPHYPEALPALK